MKPSKWQKGLLHAVLHACISEVKGRMSGCSYRWAGPKDNHWGTWRLQVAPSIIELSGGSDDGATAFDFMDVDLVALPQCLQAIESFAYDPDHGDRPHLTLIGKTGKHEVVVEIYFEPFEDDEPATVFDVNQGSRRDKPGTA